LVLVKFSHSFLFFPGASEDRPASNPLNAGGSLSFIPPRPYFPATVAPHFSPNDGSSQGTIGVPFISPLTPSSPGSPPGLSAPCSLVPSCELPGRHSHYGRNLRPFFCFHPINAMTRLFLPIDSSRPERRLCENYFCRLPAVNPSFQFPFALSHAFLERAREDYDSLANHPRRTGLFFFFCPL